ncbi:uncharacterized protein SPSK_03792 [Sporothrix schenckii 1099-18]|uniref:Uncharacterized protein n=1 Tax=Sporothrix schenckii 1099-18 TaxID=1397361 RepID=A0A0F2LZ38_SPOSC|nr:uncharacterized protein SPSK_03792 [Sporothrix schenckii 1099-18]KJR82732.1 hypothetical protein SPSK_03792 [Sporothrix schenckii 1099-18]
MARMAGVSVAVEVLCGVVVVWVVWVVWDAPVVLKCLGDAVRDDEMCDDDSDGDESWEEEEGRLLVSLYPKAGSPWPHERDGEVHKKE